MDTENLSIIWGEDIENIFNDDDDDETAAVRTF